MSFADRLDAAVEAVRSPALVGIDPHLDLLPEEFALARDAEAPRAERAAAVEAFGRQLVELCAGTVAAVKPQSAFFELLGADGVRAFEEVVRCAREHGLLVIGDVKRGDISSTAAAYARAFLEGPADPAARCDAITVSPYLGPDTLEPFVEVASETGAGLFVLVRTSNPGSAAFQEHGSPTTCERVAAEVERLGEPLRAACGYSSIGAVVGATHAAELARLRAALPHAPLLVPGYGAQGAGAAEVAPAFPDRAHPWRGGLVNSSRGIAFAWRRPENQGRSWKDAARDALAEMTHDLRTALEIPAP